METYTLSDLIALSVCKMYEERLLDAVLPDAEPEDFFMSYGLLSKLHESIDSEDVRFDPKHVCGVGTKIGACVPIKEHHREALEGGDGTDGCIPVSSVPMFVSVCLDSKETLTGNQPKLWKSLGTPLARTWLCMMSVEMRPVAKTPYVRLDAVHESLSLHSDRLLVSVNGLSLAAAIDLAMRCDELDISNIGGGGFSCPSSMQGKHKDLYDELTGLSEEILEHLMDSGIGFEDAIYALPLGTRADASMTITYSSFVLLLMDSLDGGISAESQRVVNSIAGLIFATHNEDLVRDTAWNMSKNLSMWTKSHSLGGWNYIGKISNDGVREVEGSGI